MKQHTKSSNITIGLDLGDHRHRFCALDQRGEVVEEGSLCNDRDSLMKLAGRYHGALGGDGGGSAQSLDQSIAGRVGLAGGGVQPAQGAGRFAPRLWRWRSLSFPPAGAGNQLDLIVTERLRDG
jgi:hypothetical protein